MASTRDILRAVRDYQRPIHRDQQVFTRARTLMVDGVPLTIKTKELVIRTVDKVGNDAQASTLSIFEPK